MLPTYTTPFPTPGLASISLPVVNVHAVEAGADPPVPAGPPARGGRPVVVDWPGGYEAVSGEWREPITHAATPPATAMPPAPAPMSRVRRPTVTRAPAGPSSADGSVRPAARPAPVLSSGPDGPRVAGPIGDHAADAPDPWNAGTGTGNGGAGRASASAAKAACCASITRATSAGQNATGDMPLTRRAASTSARNRRTNSGSCASSGWMTLTATIRPPGEVARNTRPIPWPTPAPIAAPALPARPERYDTIAAMRAAAGQIANL